MKLKKRFIVICANDPSAYHVALNELNGEQIEAAVFEFVEGSDTFPVIARAMADHFQFPN